MARIESIEQRLQRWVRWRATSGGGSTGYSGIDLTDYADMNAGRGSLYATASIPMLALEARATDDAVQRLPGELRATVECLYLGSGTYASKLYRLQCSADTAGRRIERAHQALAEHFAALEQRARAERARVEAITRDRAR